MSEDIRNRFGACVRQLRLARGWSQEDLAGRSGLHRTYVGSVERGERNVSLANIDKLARALQVGIEELLAGTQRDQAVAGTAEAQEFAVCTPLPVDPTDFNPDAQLPHGCTTEHVREAMNDFVAFLGLVNRQTHAQGIHGLETIMMPANFSSMVGEFVKTAIAEHCPSLASNRFHNGHPDLLPEGRFPGNSAQHTTEGIEIKASRYDKGWQGHNRERTWLMVFVFDANRDRDMFEDDAAAYPFRFKRVLGAQLVQDDWKFAGRAAGSRRTITTSVRPSGYEKMNANWIYQRPGSEG